MIDFDEMRLGDPNFDLAHFCANLHLLAYRLNNSPFHFNALQSAFLRGYAGPSRDATDYLVNLPATYDSVRDRAASTGPTTATARSTACCGGPSRSHAWKRADTIEGEGQLHVHRLLGPEGTVVVEGCDAVLRSNEIG